MICAYGNKEYTYSIDNANHTIVNASPRRRAVEEYRFCIIDHYLKGRRLHTIHISSCYHLLYTRLGTYIIKNHSNRLKSRPKSHFADSRVLIRYTRTLILRSCHRVILRIKSKLYNIPNVCSQLIGSEH